MTVAAYGQVIAVHAANATVAGTSEAAFKSNLGYSGEQWDASLRMQNLRARAYDPASGRFIGLDPFAGYMQDPQSLHKYAYVHGDPIGMADPTGLFGAGATLGSISIGNTVSQQYNDAVMDVYGAVSAGYEAHTRGEDFFDAMEEAQKASLISRIPIIGPIWDLINLAGSLIGMLLSVFDNFFGTATANAYAQLFADAAGPTPAATATTSATASMAMMAALPSVPTIPASLQALTTLRWSTLSYIDKIKRREIAATYGRRLAKQYALSAETVPYWNSNALSTPGQANHLNQSAAFDGIGHYAGKTVAMPGSASGDFGTPHFEFHRTLEVFWDQFRENGPRHGKKPSVAEYNEAMRKALKDAGFSRTQVDILNREALDELTGAGYELTDLVDKIPSPVYQSFRDLF